MPNDRRVRSPAFDCSRVSPYPSSTKQCRPENPIGLGFAEADVDDDDVQVWQDARCPICMENPHNAVLLRCSSFEKGCRPFMCNTSYRHSNCLDQFCKSPTSSPSTMLNVTEGGGDMQGKLLCPLCRGEIQGWSVIGSARVFMNNISRTCSAETCDFKGTYNELRKHARFDHPNVRPTGVDSDRQLNWIRFERERDYENVLSSIQPEAGVSFDVGSWIRFEREREYQDVLRFVRSIQPEEGVSFVGGTWIRWIRPYNGVLVVLERQSITETDRNFLGSSNNPSPVERFELGSMPQSERDFRGRRRNSRWS